MKKRLNCDVLVIGGGIAGLASAIPLADKGKNIIVINRAGNPEESNTRYAQGGIVWWGDEDSPRLLASDIDEAGNGVGSRKAIEILSQEGPGLVESFLIKRLNIPFDRDVNGHIHLTSEAAHSKARIIHVKDYTGAAIQVALTKEAEKHPRISLLTDYTAIDCITTTHHSKRRGSAYVQTKILGTYVLNNRSGEVITILAHYTILATGGIGAIYACTTNPDGARGDGIAMAERAGAHIINMEYVQFHPTVFRGSDKTFLISETVRGEGGILMNQKSERFMAQYCPTLKELAPRDEVARAIYEEMKREGIPNVWLDCRPILKKGIDLTQRFPKIFETCLSFGVDIRQTSIPVAPAAHYLCGGIRVDEWGRTSLSKLYAVGEVSCTGLHGANRLASTSLLEGLVWGKRTADHIGNTFEEEDWEAWHIPDWDESAVTLNLTPEEFLEVSYARLRQIMWKNVGIVRTSSGLSQAWRLLSLMNVEVQEFYRQTKLSDELIGLRNAVEAALAVVVHARRNKVSCGCHFREDEKTTLPQSPAAREACL